MAGRDPRIVRSEPAMTGAKTEAVSIASLLDDARPLIVAHQRSGLTIRLHVPPDLYDNLTMLRAYETRRGNPLLLLGAEVVPDSTCLAGEFKVDVAAIRDLFTPDR